MPEVEVILATIFIGAGATAFMDGYAWLQNKLLKIPCVCYALVGRWIVGMRHGQFVHDTILQSTPRPHERLVGWSFHYAIGIFYVGCMFALMGTAWRDDPNLWNPLVISSISIVAPFLIMQPAFGFGVAASKTPAPWVARRRSLVAHLSFGLGIFFSGSTWLQLSL